MPPETYAKPLRRDLATVEAWFACRASRDAPDIDPLLKQFMRPVLPRHRYSGVAYKCLIRSPVTSAFLYSTFFCALPDTVKRQEVVALNDRPADYWLTTTVRFGNMSYASSLMCSGVVFNGARKYLNPFANTFGKNGPFCV